MIRLQTILSLAGTLCHISPSLLLSCAKSEMHNDHINPKIHSSIYLVYAKRDLEIYKKNIFHCKKIYLISDVSKTNKKLFLIHKDMI